MAYPGSREPEPDWIPDETFVIVMKTKDQYSILCPERLIPETVTHATGLRVLILHPRRGHDHRGVPEHRGRPEAPEDPV